MLCVEATEKCRHCENEEAKLEMVQRNPNPEEEAEIQYIAVYKCGDCGKSTFVDYVDISKRGEKNG